MPRAKKPLPPECKVCGVIPDEEEGEDWVGECPDCDALRQEVMAETPHRNQGYTTMRMKKILRVRAALEDIEWMIDTGERNPKALAERLTPPRKVSSVYVMLNRHRPDLKQRILWGHTSSVRPTYDKAS